MNVPPSFLRSPEFLLLKDCLGDSALQAVISLGCAFHARRSTVLPIPTKRHLSIYCDTPDLPEETLWQAMVPEWLKETGIPGHYTMPFFTQNNAQLIAAWENGNRKKRGTEPNGTELNRTEQNGTKLNRTELNRTELDARPSLRATPSPRLSVASASLPHEDVW